MMKNIIRLTAGNTDLIIRSEPAEILYWGARLDIDKITEADVLSLERGVSNGGLDVDTPVTFAAENGRGFWGSSSVDGHRDGYDWAPVFKTKSAVKNDNVFLIEAEDSVAQLALL